MLPQRYERRAWKVPGADKGAAASGFGKCDHLARLEITNAQAGFSTTNASNATQWSRVQLESHIAALRVAQQKSWENLQEAIDRMEEVIAFNVDGEEADQARNDAQKAGQLSEQA